MEKCVGEKGGGSDWEKGEGGEQVLCGCGWVGASITGKRDEKGNRPMARDILSGGVLVLLGWKTSCLSFLNPF